MADQLSQVFAALADPTRRDIVARLTQADATVGELAEPYAMSLQAVSKHLKVLEDAGVVSRRREAQRRPVHLEAEVFDLMDGWIERYRRKVEERYRRLDAVLAAGSDDGHTDHVDRGGPADHVDRGGPADHVDRGGPADHVDRTNRALADQHDMQEGKAS